MAPRRSRASNSSRGSRPNTELEGVSLRIGRVYGPYRRAHCHLKAMVEAVRAGQPVEIPCDPAFVYHYVYVDDVAVAIAVALEAEHLPHRVYNGRFG